MRAAAAFATTSAALLGGYDDLAGDGSSRGLGGHLRALARGEVSTGTVKLAGLALGGLIAAAIAPPRGGEASRGLAQLVHPSAFCRVARFARMTEK